YLTREDKLSIIDRDQLGTIDWETITPNSHGDWVNQRSDTFTTWPTIGTKDPEPGQITVFRSLSRGLETTRDSWVYNSSATKLADNVHRMVINYNQELPQFGEFCRRNGITRPKESDVTTYLRQS